ncbi:MAG: hypothetical protein JXA62_07340 [Candidatus Aminicenantes bacterium]|nr:hypothetical protein [Candidatus Aminicenantes bacterium]
MEQSIMRQLKAFLLTVFLAAGLFSQTLTSAPPQEKEVLEKIDVSRSALNVRVFSNNKPVKGLNKEDFRLLVDGRSTPIQYVQEHVLRIDPVDSHADITGTPDDERFFLLLFNISDHTIDMKPALHALFARVLRPGDRYMLMTNRFTLNSRLIRDPQMEKEKVAQILEVEKSRARAHFVWMRQALLTIYTDYKDMRVSSGGEAGGAEDLAREVFITNYSDFVQSFRTRFLRLDETEYLQLGRYLNSQPGEKYVINFFQMSYLPQVKPFSALEAQLEGAMRYHDLVQAMSVPDEIEEIDLARTFLDSGAAFHTVLMGSSNQIIQDMDGNFDFKPLTLNSQNLLTRISNATGGAVLRTNDLEHFFNELFFKEDVFYTLFFKENKTSQTVSRAIQVTVPGRDFRTVYNRGTLGDRFRWLKRKSRDTTPAIALSDIRVLNGDLHFNVSRGKIEVNASKVERKLSVSVFVFSESKGEFVESRQKDVSAFEPQLEVRIKLVQLPPGEYKIFVEVMDELTGKNDLAMTPFRVKTVSSDP